MLKIAARGVTPQMVACVSSMKCQIPGAVNAAASNVSASPKYLSQSQVNSRKFIIKDHYDFDQKVINSDNPVVVNFHADWCDPCKILTPKMSELLENCNEIDLAVINVDTNSDLVETFEVKAVPAVLAFRNGVVVDKFIGLVDANIIDSLIDKLRRKNQQQTTETGTKTPTKE